MKLIFIAKPDCAYVAIEDMHSTYADREIAEMLFDGEQAKKTHKSGWWRVERVPEKVERIERLHDTVVGFRLRDGISPSELLPENVVPDYFDETDDGENPNDIYRALYDAIVEHSPDTIVPVECEKAVIAERSADWELLETWTGVKHGIVDQIETHPALLQDKPCSLSRKDSYDIIREHVKRHIDRDFARVSSDYDFCLVVRKHVETEPTPYERCINPNARKPKYKTDYRSHREVIVLAIAPKPYEKCEVVEPFMGENHKDLKEKIESYLTNLMAEINRPVKDCQHCKGAGVIF